MHIQRHTHTSTHVQSAHKRNGENQAQEPGWEGRKKGFVRDLAHTHTKKKTQKKCQENPDIHESQEKRFEHMELPAKLLDYFLRNNKSNINQRLRSSGPRQFLGSYVVNRVLVICLGRTLTLSLCLSELHLQPIPVGVTFSNAVSKLKAQSLNVSFAMFQWKETFELELWALKELSKMSHQVGLAVVS